MAGHCFFAEPYTLLTCCAISAMARATREERENEISMQVAADLNECHSHGDYSSSRRLVMALLLQRAIEQTVPAPLTFVHLHGALGLAASDAMWDQLGSEAGPGFTFRTSAVIMAVPSVDAFPNSRGIHACLCQSGVRDFVLMDSDIVCFQSLQHEGMFSRSMVPVGGGGYHLPAGAYIELVSVDEKFRVITRQGLQLIKRRLYTVHVRFSIQVDDRSAVGRALPPCPPSRGLSEIGPDELRAAIVSTTTVATMPLKFHGKYDDKKWSELTSVREINGSNHFHQCPSFVAPTRRWFGLAVLVWLHGCSREDQGAAGIHQMDTV